MRRKGGTMVAPAVAMWSATLALFAGALGLGGCAALEQIGLAPPSENASAPAGPSPAELARTALSIGNLDSAEAVIAPALAPLPGQLKDGAPPPPGTIRQTAATPELLELRAELRIRQGRFPEAESDALTAIALVPATPLVPARPAEAAPTPNAKASASAPRRVGLSQRSIHIRLAQVYEDAGRDDDAEQHLETSRQLCLADAALSEHGDCNREREAIVRIRMARGRYAEAEPLVLAEIADVQSRYGAYDLRLSIAFCHAAGFYARQGKYNLSGPLFARSFDAWKTSRDDAFAEYTRTVATDARSVATDARSIDTEEPSPFDADFLRPRAGHAPFAEPCGLEEQPSILYKLGNADAAHDAIRFEQQLWAGDTEAGIAATAAFDALVAHGGDPLDVASARHAVAFVATKKGDQARAEQELRLVVEAYGAVWPTLAVSERRFRAQDYLMALESLIELLRSAQRFGEAITLGERAQGVAEGSVDPYDALRLDTLLSLAKTYREMRQPEMAETSAGRYLDAVVSARGDTSADYAWALRTISFAYLLRDEIDASQRMEMQAKAIWDRQTTVAPEF